MTHLIEFYMHTICNSLFFFSIATVMRASGCHVPDYMLAMKKHNKKEKRKLEREAPKRSSISTIPKLKKKNLKKKLSTKNSQKGE